MSFNNENWFFSAVLSTFLFLLGVVGWHSRRLHMKIDEFPTKYITKDDYKEDIREIRGNFSTIREEIKSGFSVLERRIDSLMERRERER